MSAAPADDAELALLLDGVWQRRRAELLERYATLAKSTLRLAQAGGADRDAAQEAGSEAHRLTGALGSLGFLALARDAASLERCALQAAATSLGPDDLAEVVRTCSRLGRGLVEARTRPPR